MKLHVIATAGDPESGISSMMIRSNLKWHCSYGHNSATTGTPQSQDLVFTAPVPFTGPPITPRSIDVVANPIGMIADSGCGKTKPGWGPVDIEGFVRVIVTNGQGLVDSSKTFIFDYADVGTK